MSLLGVSTYGHYITTCGRSDGRVYIYCETSNNGWVHDNTLYCDSQVTSVSLKGRNLITGCRDGDCVLWNRRDDSQVTTYQHYESSAILSDDMTKVAFGTPEDTIRIHDITTGQLLTTLLGHSGYISSIKWDRDGRSLVSGSHDRTVKTWSLNDNNQIFSVSHQDLVMSVELSISEQKIYAASGNTIITWDTYSRNISNILPTDDIVTSISTDPTDNNQFSFGLDNGMVNVVSRVGNVSTLNRHQDSICAVIYRENGDIIAGSYDGHVHVR